MDRPDPRFPATHFQLFMALLNTRGVWASRVGGSLVNRWSPTTLFRFSALVEALPLVLRRNRERPTGAWVDRPGE